MLCVFTEDRNGCFPSLINNTWHLTWEWCSGKKEGGREEERQGRREFTGWKEERKGGKEDRRQEEGKEGKREGKKGRAEQRRESALYSTSRQLASSNRTDLISCWVKQIQSILEWRATLCPISTSPWSKPASLLTLGSQPLRMKDYPWFDLHKALFFYPDAQSVVLWTEH